MCAQVDTNNAITILKYRLEVPEDLNPTSPIWNYNTQVAGQVRRPPSRLGARALSSKRARCAVRCRPALTWKTRPFTSMVLRASARPAPHRRLSNARDRFGDRQEPWWFCSGTRRRRLRAKPFAVGAVRADISAQLPDG